MTRELRAAFPTADLFFALRFGVHREATAYSVARELIDPNDPQTIRAAFRAKARLLSAARAKGWRP